MHLQLMVTVEIYLGLIGQPPLFREPLLICRTRADTASEGEKEIERDRERDRQRDRQREGRTGSGPLFGFRGVGQRDGGDNAACLLRPAQLPLPNNKPSHKGRGALVAIRLLSVHDCYTHRHTHTRIDIDTHNTW
jgi:hypothetical protein